MMKKVNELGTKNEGKEYEKKSDNIILKDCIKNVHIK